MSMAVRAEKFARKTRLQVSLFKSKSAIRFGAQKCHRKILVKFRCRCLGDPNKTATKPLQLLAQLNNLGYRLVKNLQ
jgi:hypothetical protein